MSKKVVVISSSPRRNGNSNELCAQFIKGAKESGHRVEQFFLNDMRLNFCIACEVCQSNGGTCLHKDDMDAALQAMVAADVIVFATPVYYYAMAGQMKTFIDRTFAKGQSISGKEFYLIITVADDRKQALERTIEEFRGFFECIPAAKEAGIIYGTGVLNRGEVKGMDAMTEAYEMGKQI